MSDESTDIIILGGGIAGYAAAMAASENCRVTLIDKGQGLGGATTQSNVGTLCGLYYRAPVPTLIPHDFCERFVTELFNHDDQAHLVSLPDDLHVISYEWSNLQRLFIKHLSIQKIKVFTDADVRQVNSENGKVKSVVVKHSNTQSTLTCKSIVDCSGTGFIAQKLNHEMMSSDSYQSAAQVIRFGNVKTSNEYSLNLALKKAMIKNLAQWPAAYTSISVVPGSLRNKMVDLKLQLSSTITDEPDLIKDLEEEVRLNLPGLVAILNQVESLAESAVDRIFPSPGVRTQQRPKGKFVLTGQDVLACKKYDDGVAIGTWPIEEWDYHGKVTLEFFNPDDGYTIPARCLQSGAVNNLFFGGKGISAESKAIASARVTGTCLQTGYAAGKLAACETQVKKEKVIQEIHSQISSRI